MEFSKVYVYIKCRIFTLLLFLIKVSLFYPTIIHGKHPTDHTVHPLVGRHRTPPTIIPYHSTTLSFQKHVLQYGPGRSLNDLQL
jgi:hypothetical protein